MPYILVRTTLDFCRLRTDRGHAPSVPCADINRPPNPIGGQIVPGLAGLDLYRRRPSLGRDREDDRQRPVSWQQGLKKAHFAAFHLQFLWTTSPAAIDT